MLRDDVAERLRQLDEAPVLPRPELHEALFERLNDELARPRASGRRSPSLVAKRRLGVVFAVLLGAAAVIAVVLAVRTYLGVLPPPVIEEPVGTDEAPRPTETPAPDTALSVVLGARHQWLSAPRPVHVIATTIRYDGEVVQETTTREIWVRDERAWRTESHFTPATPPADPWAQTLVWDGERLVSVDSSSGSAIIEHHAGAGTYVFGTPLTDWLGTIRGWQQRCASGVILPEESVAGHAASHVRCGDEDLWIDAETGLLLRHERPAGVDEQDPSASTFEVTLLEYDPGFAADRFDTTPPAGAEVQTLEEYHALVVGGPPPPFDTVTPSGEVVTLDTLRGRPTLIVFWDPGLFDFGVVEEVARENPDRIQIVAYDGRRDQMEQHAAYMREHGYTVPLVFDVEASAPGQYPRVWGDWREGGLEPIDRPSANTAQFWVVLDADGTVRAVRGGNMIPEQIEAWLAANGV